MDWKNLESSNFKPYLNRLWTFSDMDGLVLGIQLYMAIMASVRGLTQMWQIGNLHIQNFVMLELVKSNKNFNDSGL
jgi:hypothetical protein